MFDYEQFRDRFEAGRLLGQKLLRYANRQDALVLALPRGGVPVGYEVARTLRIPLDIFLVRKLGVPGQEELAMGALGSGGAYHLNGGVIHALHISSADIEAAVIRERRELERRERCYRADRPRPQVAGKIVILVDDGLGTGSSMRVAIEGLRPLSPARIVVAVPVGSPDIRQELSQEADEVLCLRSPTPFYAVGCWYKDFSQITDDEVRDILQKSEMRNKV